MKHKKISSKLLIAILVALSLVLAALIGIVIDMETGQGEQGYPAQTGYAETTRSAPESETRKPVGTEPVVPTQTVPEETVPEDTIPKETVTEETVKDLMITTPYCNLYYPAQWRDSVTVRTYTEGIGYIVTISGTTETAQAQLFSLFFVEASDASFPVGTISCDGAISDVSLELYDIEPKDGWEPADADELGAMQEGVNYLLERLEENPAFTSASQQTGDEEPGETPDVPDDLVVKTQWCDLYFPGQWGDAVRYEEISSAAGSVVVFYGTINEKEAELFTVWFAQTGEDCIPVGVLSAGGVSMEVSITMPELRGEDIWSEEEQELFYSLQEQVNYLLSKLGEEPGFSPIEP